MGMEDRDWYREKQIDWERGGLRERNPARRRFPRYLWWILGIVGMLMLALLFSASKTA